MHSLFSTARRVSILVLIATLLFSRMALASYACPLPQLQTAAPASQMKGADCTEPSDRSRMIDEVQPNLCAQHFADEKQVTSAAAQPLASEPVLFLAYPLALPSLSHVQRFAVYEFPPDPAGSDGALFLLTLRLRI